MDVVGTAKIVWSFAGESEKDFEIDCHVLPTCTYEIVLGSRFLKTTKTLSEYRHRLVDCIFKTTKHCKVNFLGGGLQYLKGSVDGNCQVLAVPDSGAERNVMDLR